VTEEEKVAVEGAVDSQMQYLDNGYFGDSSWKRIWAMFAEKCPERRRDGCGEYEPPDGSACGRRSD